MIYKIMKVFFRYWFQLFYKYVYIKFSVESTQYNAIRLPGGKNLSYVKSYYFLHIRYTFIQQCFERENNIE